ncbi:MAG: M55 family metallopeptidase [Planctomycetota bacterium]
MRLFISVDMEGITGVCHRDHLLAGGTDYERARGWLVHDVNAVIEGALSAGASEIVVADGHATMRNIPLEMLHEKAQYLTGPAQFRNRPLSQLAELDENRFDAAMLVGYHVRAGTPNGLLAHTWAGALVHEIRINGKPAGEARINAAIFGEFGIPVVLATGADDFVREVREDLGDDLVAVAVKKVIGPTAVLTQSLGDAAWALRDGAERALRQTREPYAVARPVRFEIDFHRREMCEQAAEMGGERTGDRTLEFKADKVTGAVQATWRALTHAFRSEGDFLA